MNSIDAGEIRRPISKKTTVCIVGAGISGLIVAKKLKERGIETILIERGGLETGFPGRDEILSDPTGVRIRRESLNYNLGGTGKSWDGWIGKIPKYQVIRDESRQRNSWPISVCELEKYYAQAIEFLGMPEGLKFHESFSKHLNLVNIFRVRDPHKQLESLIKSTLNSELITLIYNAQVTEIQEINGCTSVIAYSKRNEKIEIHAGLVVLTANTINTISIIANSPSAIPKNVNLGHYFMEHPKGTIGQYAIERLAEKIPDESIFHPSQGRLTGLCLNEKTFGNSISNSYIRFEERPLTTSRNYSSIFRRKDESKFLNYAIRVFFDLSPVFENHVTPISNSFSSAYVRCHPSVKDVQSIRILLENVINDVPGFSSKSKLELNQLEQRNFGLLRDASHHLGGIRMGLNPEDSVVDANLKIFSTRNIYVCGGGVFPSSGSINPTLTIVALALRLSCHLQELINPVSQHR